MAGLRRVGRATSTPPARRADQPLTLLIFGIAWLTHLSPTSLSAPTDNIEPLTWAGSLEGGYYKHPPLPTSWFWLPPKLFGATAWTSHVVGASFTLGAMALLWVLLLRMLGWRDATLGLLAVWCITCYILLIGMIGVDWTMVSTEDEPGCGWFFSLHKSVEIVILALVACRTIWRLRHPPVPLPVSVPAWQETPSKVSPRLLYAAMIAMPLLGLMGSAFSQRGLEHFDDSLARAIAPNHCLVEALFTAQAVVAWALVAPISVQVAIHRSPSCAKAFGGFR